MAGEVLVGFDIDAIQDFVFAPVRPLDVAGSSRIVEEFSLEAESILQRRGVQIVYVGGGNGIGVAPDPATGEATSVALEQAFDRLTLGAGSCTAAWVPVSESFPTSRAALQRELARRKNERLLDEGVQELIPAGLAPHRVCEGCGRELATGDPDLGDRIGDQCRERRHAGRSVRGAENHEVDIPFARDLEALFGEDEQDGRESDSRSLIAAVYLDADRAGERISELSTPEELGRWATGVREATRSALRDGLQNLGLLERRVVAPVVGGDDILVFCAAEFAARLVQELWRRLDEHMAPIAIGMTFSAGVAIGSRYLPLRLLVDTASTALRASKEQRLSSDDDAFVTVRSLAAGRLHDPQRPVFGGSLPRQAWWTDGDPATVRALAATLSKASPAQRAGLFDDISQGSHSLRRLDAEYRATRTPAIAEALRVADSIAEVLQADSADDRWSDVLAGGLFAAELWVPNGVSS